MNHFLLLAYLCFSADTLIIPRFLWMELTQSVRRGLCEEMAQRSGRSNQLTNSDFGITVLYDKLV